MRRPSAYLRRPGGYHPALFWLAVATAATALLPIVVGALVTTKGAGMAFRDWPTSDGQGMLSYPWLSSAGDKFIEHGHRLAGITIGCVSIAFALCAWLLESRRWVRYCALGVLAAVIAQGLLGGTRVLADARAIAMVHGAFAAAVFAFMATMALVLSRSWLSPPPMAAGSVTPAVKILSAVMPVVILVQYSLGGLVRHLGTALYEHLGTAAVVLLCVAATVFAVRRTRSAWLTRPAYALAAVTLCQIALGAGAWVTRFGLPYLNYVAVERSLLQTVVRTSHTVVGMLLLMTSVLLLARVLRAAATGRLAQHAAADRLLAERPIELPPRAATPAGLRAAGLKGAR